MLLKSGVFLVFAVVGGCLLSIFFLIPAEQAFDILNASGLATGEMGDEQNVHRQLSEKSPLLKVLFMSGYTARGSLQNEVLRPGLPFIPKPFGPPELARKIREVLGVGRALDPDNRSTGNGAHWKM